MTYLESIVQDTPLLLISKTATSHVYIRQNVDILAHNTCCFSTQK